MNSRPSDREQLMNIFRLMNGEVFGIRSAAAIVGGRGRLMQLITDGKVRARKGASAKNSKWSCNASDVLRYARYN